MNGFSTIETDRLFIRTLEMGDKESFFTYRAMPEIYQYQAWRPKCMEEAEKFIRKNAEVVANTVNTWLQLAVCKKQGQMLGDIGIHFVDQAQIEIGYTLSREQQSNGYAFEAVKAVMAYAFSEWKKHRIIASVDPGNLRSIRLLEKIGFRKEAHFVKSFRVENRWCDDCIYALLEEEWNALDRIGSSMKG